MSKFTIQIERQDNEVTVKDAKTKDEVIRTLIDYIVCTLGDKVTVKKDDEVIYE